MAKKEEQTTPTPAAEDATPAEEQQLTTLQKIRRQATEGDDTPAASLRFRDVLGGDLLWALVRHHVWLIILVVLITATYVAVRYQCQQDAIDISQLERELVDAKFESLSSSSNLTRLSRQRNIKQMLRHFNDTTLVESTTPPFIIEVPK